MTAVTKTSAVVLGFIALTILNPQAAVAHSFRVALVISQGAGETGDGRFFRDGFMLATTERDGHPNQGSDGHLGGLDVYVSVVDAQGDVQAALSRLARQGEVVIVAAFGSDQVRSAVQNALADTKTVLLPPGRLPAASPNNSALPDFIDAYTRIYGIAPTPAAAQGYNAARRIDAAVRAQGGVADGPGLRRALEESACDFSW